VNEEIFITYFIHTLYSFHFKDFIRSFIIDTSASHARIFFLSFDLYTTSFFLKLIPDQYDTTRKGSNNSFITDVLSSVDRFNQSSINISLSFQSMSNDSILVAILCIQRMFILPLLITRLLRNELLN
jgi:hypothetical protein